jgi:hypothetical protein
VLDHHYSCNACAIGSTVYGRVNARSLVGAHSPTLQLFAPAHYDYNGLYLQGQQTSFFLKRNVPFCWGMSEFFLGLV